MAPDPKLHHFVPRLILKRFTDQQGRLHVFNRNSPRSGVYATKPHKAFAQKHLYTQIAHDGTRDVTVEMAFAQIESRAEELVEKIVTTARRLQKPQLTDSELADWCRFTFLQWKRVPERLNPLVVENEPLIAEALVEFEETVRPMTREERSRLSDSDYRKQLLKNAAARASLKSGDEVEALMYRRGISVGVISDFRRSFVVGSRPITKVHPPDDAHLGNPAVGVLFPIASDVIVLTAETRRQETLYEYRARDVALVRKANMNAASGSLIFAGRSPDLVRSLICPR